MLKQDNLRVIIYEPDRPELFDELVLALLESGSRIEFALSSNAIPETMERMGGCDLIIARPGNCQEIDNGRGANDDHFYVRPQIYGCEPVRAA